VVEGLQHSIMAAVQTPQAIIEAAFTRLKNSITVEDARTFHSTQLQDVRQAAIDIEKWQRNRGSLRNMKRIEPFLKSIEKYSNVIETLCNQTPYLPFVWVSFGRLGARSQLSLICVHRLRSS